MLRHPLFVANSRKMRYNVCKTREGIRMKKHIANIITASRILFSVVLLFLPVLGTGFYVIYLLCGVTDMIDGTIARKTDTVSEFGARLDTVADFVFLSVSLVKFLPIIHISQWLWVWIAVIGAIKVGNLIGGFFRTKTFVSLHTVTNKITGLLLFLLPLTFPVIDLNYSSVAVCVVASIAAIQESIYIATGFRN